jgi:dipeptidyl aminopeptidase/acylaminoacyl peptidase
MLVIHGDRDHRVPIGEALRLWSDLMARCSDQVPHKFLYFPDENHWVLRRHTSGSGTPPCSRSSTTT